jgi:hypothetical protein
MARILIAGDSWGLGELNVQCTEVLHGGLANYFANDGHEVINISKGGCSNLDIVHRLSTWIERFGCDNIDLIIVLQTEYTRDYKHVDTESNDWNIQSLSDLSSQWIERFYMRLSELSVLYSVPIKIIGGCSDTLWFDNMSNDYPGCQIACQSISELLINDNHCIDTPVFSWYNNNTKVLLDRMKKKTNRLDEMLAAITLGFERESLLKANPHFFFPDGKHPNRLGHYKLYQFLTKQLSDCLLV